jgi:hypothetical protein
MAWCVLDAANDLRDTGTVEACRRVIDARLRGGVPAQSDMNFVFIFQINPRPGHPYGAGPCGAVRGTLAALHDLARRGDDVFEF